MLRTLAALALLAAAAPAAAGIDRAPAPALSPPVGAVRSGACRPFPSWTNIAGQNKAIEAWALAGTTVSANAATAPDGTATADKVVESAATEAHTVRNTIGGIVAGATYMLSVYAKAGERTVVGMYPSGALGNVPSMRALLTNCTVSYQLNTTPTVAPVGDGWCRLSMITTASGNGTGYLWVSLYNGAGTYAGNGTSGAYLWGADVHPGTQLFPVFTQTTASITKPAGCY